MITSAHSDTSSPNSNGQTCHFSACASIAGRSKTSPVEINSNTASFTRSKCPFAYGQASGLHSASPVKQIFSFAVSVTARNFNPFSRRIEKASSATVRVMVFAVR